jgi:hypothetical protein
VDLQEESRSKGVHYAELNNACARPRHGMSRALIVICLLIIAACGGNESPAPPAPSTRPTISGLAANFSTNGCIRSADGLAGRALVITFDFTDAPGAIAGGHVQLSRLYNTGRSETHSFTVPSEVTLSGSGTAGQVRIGNACPLYNDATGSTETLTLIDAGGLASNSLSTAVTRPAGAP